MTMRAVLDPGSVLSLLKAAAEPTRLRILMLLAGGELNVKDLTRILGQSQPRISRHLKLLAEAGLIRRLRDGSWVYFQNVDEGVHGALLHRLLGATDATDSQLVRDRQRWDAVKREREAAAQAFFQTHAADWDRIRAMHVDEGDVETAMRAALGNGPFGLFVDLGTGTGRSLELFADTYQRGLGLDINHTMLAYARGKLDAADLPRAQVRHGDLYHLGLADGSADAVVMHQVLHFLSEPAQAVREAARILAPGGRLLIVDFAPHELEFLRQSYAHERLGFPASIVSEWLTDAGLEAPVVQELKPPAGAKGDRLTVTLWLAQRAGSRPRAGQSTHSSMEVIG
jgi:ubiquinone/menaquinone biosynthesis C-methylase UbiE/DNA-binding transcriptional ArsR family regulator